MAAAPPPPAVPTSLPTLPPPPPLPSSLPIRPPPPVLLSFPLTLDLTTSYIPQEILLNIFSWLPAKSVGKCRCLAKPWRTLLSTPEFIKSHLTRRPHQENIILISRDYFIVSIKKDVVCREIEFRHHCSNVLGSCDGLVLLGNMYVIRGSCLINPLTRWHMEIPEPPLVGKHDVIFKMFGFGYDGISDDYKVVTVYYDTFEEEQFVDVYSVKGGIWKRIGISPYNSLFVPSYGVFVNGAIHWLNYKYKMTSSDENVGITVFNLETEVFHEIPLPAGICVEGIEDLILLDGCLYIKGWDVDGKAGERKCGWLKKDYCLEESWTKFTINDGNCRLRKPLCFINDEEVVWLTYCPKNLLVYNLKEGTMRDIVVDVAPVGNAKAGTFIESLVSPAQRNMLQLV